MAFDWLKVRPLSRATSTWANAIVDALNQLYGGIEDLDARKLDIALLARLPYDIIPDEALKRLLGQFGKEWLAIYAGTGFFTQDVFVRGRRVLKDGDPITVYDISEPAKGKITEAIDASRILSDIYGALREPLPRTLSDIESVAQGKITGAIDSSSLISQIYATLREPLPRYVSDIAESVKGKITEAIDATRVARYVEEVRDYTRLLPGMDTKLADIREYTRLTSEYVARIYVDKEGRVGVTILQPVDMYGNVLVRSVESIAKPFFRKKIEEGKAFAVSHRFEGVASDASVSIYFENPPYSGKTVYVQLIRVTPLANAYLDIYRNATRTGIGTKLTPFNLNMGSPRESVVDVEYGGTYEGGQLAVNETCPGGSGVRAIGEVVEVGENIIIPPGHNIVITVTNASASATDISIKILWYEE